MLADPPPKRRNPEFRRSLSMPLLRFLQMRRKRSYLLRSALQLRIQIAEGLK
jgi:hypothetical protein